MSVRRILLQATSGGGELVSAHLLRAWALAHLGDIDQARKTIDDAKHQARGDQATEVAYEAAEIEALYGDASASLAHLAPIRDGISGETDTGEQIVVFFRHHGFRSLTTFRKI